MAGSYPQTTISRNNSSSLRTPCRADSPFTINRTAPLADGVNYGYKTRLSVSRTSSHYDSPLNYPPDVPSQWGCLLANINGVRLRRGEPNHVYDLDPALCPTDARLPVPKNGIIRSRILL